MNKNYILSGTPGSGKTTQLLMLERLGYRTVQESATDIIALEQALGHEKPWESLIFIEQITNLQQQRYQTINSENIVFFDRSPICTYALCKYLKFDPPQVLLNSIRNMHEQYEKEVLFIKNLGHIKNTDARQISFDEALEFEKMHLEAYDKFGFECLIIEPEPIDKRTQTLLDKIGLKHELL